MTSPKIKVKNISKKFRIPHEKINTVRGAFVNIFKKKTYEEFHALKNVSFEVKQGEFFGIIGRNGSGKSTLLKILANIYRNDTGHIEVNGRISPFLELGIGFNPELSGRDNIYLNATILGLSKKQIDEKFDRIVAFSELKRFIDQKIKNYSSGMQVRLAFSVAIHANRDILLMDEVLAVGDTNFQQKCIEEFHHWRDLGKTVILVSHDLSVIERYCNRAMLLREGNVEMIGDPNDVIALYTYQNMSDQEKQLYDKEKINGDQQQKGKKIKKTAEITSVEFVDQHGQPQTVFQTGDTITARIHYNARKRIERPVFGVALHTQDGIHLSGPNTKTSKYFIDSLEGKGYIDFSILSAPFFTGYFYFTAALFSWECITPYDFHDREYRFKVISSALNQHGVVKLEIIWKLEQ